MQFMFEIWMNTQAFLYETPIQIFLLKIVNIVVIKNYKIFLMTFLLTNLRQKFVLKFHTNINKQNLFIQYNYSLNYYYYYYR